MMKDGKHRAMSNRFDRFEVPGFPNSANREGSKRNDHHLGDGVKGRPSYKHGGGMSETMGMPKKPMKSGGNSKGGYLKGGS